MAVVKADAYGHGAEAISAGLCQAGVETFAVATVTEAIQLRQSGLDGGILVIGYTPAQDAEFLVKYDLIQMVADGAHAKALNDTGCKLRVHIAVDTGMHRLGIEPKNLAEIESIYACENLIVEGIASHFAVSDSFTQSDIAFTRSQHENFLATVDALRTKGYNTGKLHIQSSTGIYTCSELNCDYVRPGIALYGAMTHNADTGLKPVLSLRARVAQVRHIDAGESVSYGRTFTSESPMKIATVSIGYADGVPRQMSGSGTECLLHGRRVPIIGRICMDMLMIDVTEIGTSAPGDVVTLIGRDGDAEILCEEFAAKTGTITHDVLCRLGGRVVRIYVNRANA